MNTAELDRLTERAAQLDGAAAFVSGRLMRAALGPLIEDESMVGEWARRRPSIPRHLYELARKAAIAPIDLSSGLASAVPSAQGFLAAVTRESLVGQIGALSVDGYASGAIQTGNATASWSGEQASKPITSLSFTAASLRPLKLVSQIVVTKELADLAAPSALMIVQRALMSAIAAAEASALLDPASAAVANVKPASLTNGISPIVAAGDFANNVGQVLGALSGGDPSRPTLIVSFQTATRLQSMVGDLAAIGVKVVISSAAGNSIIGVDADGVLVATGGIEIQRGAPTIQLDDSPASPPVASTIMTSLWQRDLLAIKCERLITWTARPGAVALLTLT